MMGLAAALLGWLMAHTAIFSPDGLRYIAQAQRIERGAWVDGLFRSVDHPVYPLAIAAGHRQFGGERPEDWQDAAQAASVVAGILLVVPLYLVALELFGPRAAWLGVALIYAVPLSAHVFADVLSESTFLLFWSWGLWTALRFLKQGRFGWLPPTIGFSALAYLSRPEGLLLPAALVATLLLIPLLRSTRLNWPRWWAAVGVLVLGPACLVGPYIVAKGGLGTKPAIQRLLGTAPHSAPDAVERQRPLDPNQSTARTYALAVKAMFEAVRDATTTPLLALSVLGIAGCRPFTPRARTWLFLAIIAVASVLALVRLHATGGYCSPRHAMVLAMLLIPAGAAGLDLALRTITIPGRWIGQGEARFRPGPAVWVATLGGFLAWSVPQVLTPINHEFAGYRGASRYLREHVPAGEKVADVTGWTLYYERRPGYTFGNLIEAPHDPKLRWVVVREAHLRGPWTYCAQLRALVQGLEPLATFPEQPTAGQALVYVFDRQARPAATAQSPPAAVRR
ncbi:MAG: glycosyltransferase family 39 protein [Isosphaeraceae bacterium]|nr:glycosyltransferase family 39 protein [Isosphaeraceae bacterium]